MQRWLFAGLAALLALSGCATVNRMAFDKNAKTVDTQAKSVVLMTIDVARTDGSRFVPKPFVVKLERPNAQTKDERQNFRLAEGDDSIEADDGHPVFLARMALEPGPYTIFHVVGRASAFPINSLFVVPIMADIDVEPGRIVYVGHVTARLRPRNDDEFRAGPVIPLIDQAISGISGGTWDVTIEDRADTDLPLFRSNYAALANATIERRPLPAFDRARAQRWWDGEGSGSDQPGPAVQPVAR